MKCPIYLCGLDTLSTNSLLLRNLIPLSLKEIHVTIKKKFYIFSTNQNCFISYQFINVTKNKKMRFSIFHIFLGHWEYIATVLFPFDDMTPSSSCSREKENIIKFVVRDICAPSPLNLTWIFSFLNSGFLLRGSLTWFIRVDLKSSL